MLNLLASKDQNGPPLNKGLIFFLLLVLGATVLIAYTFFQPSKNKNSSNQKPSAAPSIVTTDINAQILRDITPEIDCELVDAQGKTTNNSCRVDKVVGDFAKGNMVQAYWIAAKTNGKWKVVVTGNGIPTCSEIDKYLVPKDIYGNCIQESGELRF